MQEKTPIAQDETLSTLTEKLARQGASLLLKALDQYLAGKITPQTQPEGGDTYAAMLSKEEGRLDFSELAVVIDRKVRALNDWPGTFYDFNGQGLKIRKVEVQPCEAHQSGLRSVINKVPAISTPDAWVKLLEVQPPGKKWMSGADFVRGAQNWTA